MGRLVEGSCAASVRFTWFKTMTKVELKSRARSHQDRIELRKIFDLLDKFNINDFDDLGDIANSA